MIMSQIALKWIFVKYCNMVMTMDKIILIDADGVLLKKHGLFSEKFATEYNIPIEKVIPFFKNEFRECQVGSKDIKVVLPPYLKEWGWQKSVDEFLQYWFETDTVVDEEVMSKLEEFLKQGIVSYLVTDQEKYRAKYINEVLNLKHRLSGCFFSCDLGVSKSDPKFFEKLIVMNNIDRKFYIYFDDEEKNIEIAREVGIESFLYKNIDDLQVSIL